MLKLQNIYSQIWIGSDKNIVILLNQAEEISHYFKTFVTLFSTLGYIDAIWVEPIGWVDIETSGSSGEGWEVTGEREKEREETEEESTLSSVQTALLNDV